MAFTHFNVTKDTMDGLVSLGKNGGWGWGVAKAGDLAPATSLWGMLYADDDTAVSQRPEQPTKIIVVIVTVSEASGLIVYEVKPESMCL